jgi:anaerobic selenocysteine-containing dehydrogenase
MKYYDYEWDLEPHRILLDAELDLDKLGWRHGDCFKIINRNGRAMLVKMESVEQFARGYKVNE